MFTHRIDTSADINRVLVVVFEFVKGQKLRGRSEGFDVLANGEVEKREVVDTKKSAAYARAQ
jgi:hypothetical protein